MRILFLSTSSGETDKYASSLACLKPDSVRIVRYDVPEYAEALMVYNAKQYAPSFIVYIGSRWGPQPTILTLAKLNSEVAPMVHICSDAGDPPWHDRLAEYHYAGAFALQVAIDGNPNWPGAQYGMTALTPINPELFNGMRPHAERPILCGFAGNPGGNGTVRRYLLSEMMLHKSLDVRLRLEGPETYKACCEYMQECRLTLNTPWTGSGQALHVKGRVLEAGLAGSCLLEFYEAPTNLWFKPNVDYVEFQHAGHAIELVHYFAKNSAASEIFGRRLREKVLTEHTPIKFWIKVLKRIGVEA